LRFKVFYTSSHLLYNALYMHAIVTNYLKIIMNTTLSRGTRKEMNISIPKCGRTQICMSTFPINDYAQFMTRGSLWEQALVRVQSRPKVSRQ
jgi:hypothetical protein